MAGFVLRLLGPPELQREGQALALPTRKLWALVAFLATQAEAISRERLATLLWGDQDEERARANLRQELYRLKGTAAEGFFTYNSESIGLSPHQADLKTVEDLLVEKRWSEALAQFRGEFAQGLMVRGAPEFEDWLLLEREHWLGLWKEAARNQAESLGAKAPGEALKLYQKILEADPFQEDLQRALIHLTARLDSPSAALKLYERYKTLLQKEFSLEPLSETKNLVEQIRSGKVALSPPSPAPVQSLPSTLELPTLVGRAREWEQLGKALRSWKSVFISGEPGVGKTRLMQEFAQSTGLPIAVIRGYPGDTNVPYSTAARFIRSMLEADPKLELEPWIKRELSRLLPNLVEPDLADGGVLPIHSPQERLRLFEAYAALAQKQKAFPEPFMALVDDLQFFDRASNEMFAFETAQALARKAQRVTLLAFRNNELPGELQQPMHEQVRAGMALWVDLEPLDEASVYRLIEGLSNTQAPLFSKRLYMATGGNPLFVLETLRELFAAGEIQVEQGRWYTLYDQDTSDYSELPLPQSVREATLRRVERIGGVAQRFLQAASLAGEGFGLEELSGVTALSDWEALEALETAQQAGLLQPEASGYRFSHDLVRRALVEGMNPERKRLLHRKLAANLEKLEGAPAQIAEHLEQAGKPAQALPWHLKAAQAAERIYAHREALAQYSKALAAGASQESTFAIHAARARLWKILDERDPWADELKSMQQIATQLGMTDLKAQASIAQAELEVAAGQYAQALAHVEHSPTQSLAPALAAQAQQIAGEALVRLGRLSEAEPRLRSALEQTSEPERRGYLNNLLHVCAMQRGDFQTATLYNSAALEAYTHSSNRFGLTQSRARAGLLLGLSGDNAGAIQTLEAALVQAKEIGAIAIQRQILVNLFKFLFETGQLEVAQSRLEEGLALVREPQDPNLEGTFLNNLATVYRARGRLGQAIAAFHQAIEIADHIHSAPQSLRRRIALAENWLDLGESEKAKPLLEEARALMETTGLQETRPWLEGNLARCEFLQGQRGAAIARLDQLNPDDFSDPHDLARAHWVKGLALLALGEPRQALEMALQPVPPNPNYQARALALKLLAQSQLGQKPDTAEAQALLTTEIHPLEGLELRSALIQAYTPKQARELQQQTQRLLEELSDSLSNYPELGQRFLEHHKEIRSKG